MGLGDIFQIASQGMTAQRERVEAASTNLANANTTRTPEGGPYRRRDVVLEATQLEKPSFQSNLLELTSTLGPETLKPEASGPQGVQTSVYIAQADNGEKIYQPGHPDADPQGYLQLPDVDPLEETINMISAARAFEANATAFSTAKEMARASLRIGE